MANLDSRDVKEAGFSRNTIDKATADKFLKNFKDFAIGSVGSKIIRNNENNEPILGFFLSEKWLRKVLSEIENTHSHGLTIRYAIHSDNYLELIAQIIRFKNDDTGNYENEKIGEPYYTRAGNPEPPILGIPPVNE